MIIGVLILPVILLAIGWPASWFPGQPLRLWMAGAAALGLLCGLSAGLSRKEGTATEVVKFIGTGLIPILGSVSTLLERTEKVTEKYTYPDTQLVEKITTTVNSSAEGSLHPLAVVGSFFLAFALLAVLGEVGGARLRKKNMIDLMRTV